MKLKFINTFNERNRYTIKSTISIVRVVKNICKKLDVQYIGYLGSGSFGDVFEIEDNKRLILKITTDREEAKIASILKNRKLPGLVNYYDVKRLRSDKLKRFENYLIIMEKLGPMPKRIKSQIDNIIDKITDEESFVIPGAIDNLPNTKIKLEMEIIISSLKKLGFKEDTIDIHSENIGLDENRQLTLFDLSIVDFSFLNKSILDI